MSCLYAKLITGNGMKAAFLTCLLLAGMLLAPFHGLADEITLADGSRIQGEVIAMSDGRYHIRTRSLGVVELPADQIQSIAKSHAAPIAGAAGSSNAAVQSLQATMVQDRDVMARILNLQNDPDMQAVLQDPELMQAIQRFDMNTVVNHPKFKRLMENHEIQVIADKVN